MTTFTETIGSVAGSFGRGVLAGLAGTAAMTVSSTVEMRLRERPPSSVPVDALAKVIELEPADDAARERVSNLTHWGYGAMWGGARGLLGTIGMSPRTATAAHFAAVWGTEATMLPALELTPPVSEWGAKEVAIDVWHHLVYAVVTGLAFRLLDRAD